MMLTVRRISSSRALTYLLVACVRIAAAPAQQFRHLGQCGLAPYDITEALIKNNRLNTSEPDELHKFWRSHVPAAYRPDWSHFFRPVALRQAKLEPILEPVFIRLKVLYDETLAAQHPDVETLRRYLRNTLLDVQMVFWQPELSNTVKIHLVVVEMSQLDRRLELGDTMERILRKIETFNMRADNSTDYYDIVLVYVHRVLYDLRPDSSVLPALGVSHPYTFCNRKKNPYASKGVLVQVSTSTVTVTAHEIGHALGLMHDGSEPNLFKGTPNCDPRAYIMAAYSEIGQIRWSDCSAQALLIYLRSPSVFECVFDQARIRNTIPLSPQFDWRDRKSVTILPGKQMPPEEQCLFALGEPARPNKEPVDKHQSPWDMKILESCQALYCEVYARSIFVGPSQDGSPCLTYPTRRDGMCINRICAIPIL